MTFNTLTKNVWILTSTSRRTLKLKFQQKTALNVDPTSFCFRSTTKPLSLGGKRGSLGEEEEEVDKGQIRLRKKEKTRLKAHTIMPNNCTFMNCVGS